MCAHNTNRNSPVYTAVLFLIGKDKVMNLLDNAFANGDIVFYKLAHKIKGLFMTNRLHVVF